MSEIFGAEQPKERASLSRNFLFFQLRKEALEEKAKSREITAIGGYISGSLLGGMALKYGIEGSATASAFEAAIAGVEFVVSRIYSRKADAYRASAHILEEAIVRDYPSELIDFEIARSELANKQQQAPAKIQA